MVTMQTEAGKRAKRKYREKCFRLHLEFYPPESELYEHIKSQGNMSGYIKDLVRKDMKNG